MSYPSLPSARADLDALRWGFPRLGTGAARDLADIVAPTEAAFVFGWPHDERGPTPSITTDAGTAPADPACPDAIVLGRDRSGRPVRVADLDRRLHLAFVGATGSGKTSLFVDLAVQDVRAGRPVMVFDPHGETTARIVAAVPELADSAAFLDARTDDLDSIDVLRVAAAGSPRFETFAGALIDGMTPDLNKGLHRSAVSPPLRTRLASRRGERRATHGSGDASRLRAPRTDRRRRDECDRGRARCTAGLDRLRTRSCRMV